MKAITLHRPWSGWIALGWKTIETRLHARFACLAGQRIAIHAGQRFDPDALLAATPFLTIERVAEVLAGFTSGGAGKVVCTVLVSKVQWLDAQHSNGALIDCANTKRFGLFLEDVQRIQSDAIIPGKQGIWNWNEA